VGIGFVYSCGGCDARQEVQAPPREFISINGRGYGFGHFEYPSPADCAPKGWTAYDIIGCTYCPDCSRELFGSGDDTNGQASN
jgi:hypothetical protein